MSQMEDKEMSTIIRSRSLFSSNKKTVCRQYHTRDFIDNRIGIAILLLFFLFLKIEMAAAVPACPEGVKAAQPDGTEITIYLRGDEYSHWNENENGYLITKSEISGEWVYMIEEAGTTVAGKYAVGKADPKAIGALKPNKEKLSAIVERSLAVKSMLVEQPAFAPHTGTMYNLVILVNFSDLSVAYSRQAYDDLFNQIGYTTDGAVGSVKDYYHQISYNALTMQSTVVESVTLDNGYAYYGANDSYGYDIRPREMVQEALAKLEARGFDFRTVDGDSDGWIDGLTIIHAGGGEEYSGNDINYIWSHQWQLISPVTYDGVSMQMYHTEPARRGWDSSPSTQGITRIGVICHENGHFLGLPDLYDYGYDSEGAGNFCLMAGGSWNGNYGTSPAHMSAWCKCYLGWVSPTLISSSGLYSLGQVETNSQIFKLQGGFPSDEYFLVENRQGSGFDSGLPGSLRGILIWHIDESQANNDDQTHYKVDLEEASGTQHLALNENAGDDADYFRAGNATVFTESSIPNNLSYAGQMLNANITNVGTTGASMSVTLAFPLWSDGFESGDFTAGGWTVAGTASVTTGAKYTGTYGAQIPGSASVSSITKSKSTVGYNTIHVKYDRKLTKTSVTLVVDWSTDGNTWNVLETLTGSTLWAFRDFTCASGAGNNAGFRVRFRTTGGTSSRYAYIDNVQITGTAIPSTTTVPDVVGQTQAAAATAITGAGLVVGTVTQAYSDTVAAGLVISQYPAGETIVLIGSAVDIIISLGPQARSISGYVMEPDVNTPVEGVQIDANNNGGSTDITDVNGYYELTVAYGWSGTVIPSKTGYTFEPNGIDYNNVTTDQNDNYTAILDTFIIWGYAVDSGLIPLDSVLVSPDNNGGPWTSKYYGGGSDTTDANGYYEVVVDYNWSGEVVPAKYAYIFEPNNIGYVNVTSDYNNQDYTGALLRFIISGHIKNSCNVPIADVLMDANNGGGQDTTDANGFYEVWVDYNWSGTVIPTRKNYTFNPYTREYAGVLNDQTDQDYSANNIYDLDCDGSIGFGDVGVISDNWLVTGENIPGDIYKDENNIVNFLDLSMFAEVWLDN
ncbi:MAG: M6 family metalloprotease domain-containing protein [Phycisphaerae bacterium]|nr:M6 family metalloprotease domain-containing protein [Phycisphaerae bacterium]